MNIERLRRSALYLPGSNQKAIDKARMLPCDVVILDLEDAVAPDAKKLAREQVLDAVTKDGFGAREVVVRVNGIDTPWGEDDLAAFRGSAAAAILVPKIEAAGDVNRYREQLPRTPIWAMIETTRSIFALQQVAASGVAALVMGTNDLAKEMHARLSTDRLSIMGFLGLAVAAARSQGIPVLDGVFNDLEDMAGFGYQCEQAVDLGMDGKTLIHPRQIEICNAAFSPSEAEVEWARAVVSAFELPENSARGAIQIDGRMVERLHLEQALRTLARHGTAPTGDE